MKTEKEYLDKLLKMGEEFQEAYRKKDWFRAKYLYDTASTITVFLKALQEVREKLWGCYNEERDAKEQGLFDDDMPAPSPSTRSVTISSPFYPGAGWTDGSSRDGRTAGESP